MYVKEGITVLRVCERKIRQKTGERDRERQRGIKGKKGKEGN